MDFLFFGPLLIQGISYAIKQVALWAAFLHLKPYIIWILIAIAGYFGAKGGYWVIKSLAILWQSKVMRYLLGALLVFVSGVGTGFYLDPDTPKPEVHKVRAIEERVRSKDGAVLIEGKTYYKAEFINEVLRQRGYARTFKPSIG